MGVTEAIKIETSDHLGSIAKLAFFLIADLRSFRGPLDDSWSKYATAMTPIKI